MFFFFQNHSTTQIHTPTQTQVRTQSQQPWVYENLPSGEEGGPRCYDQNQKLRLLAAACRIYDLDSIVKIESRLRLHCGVTEDCFAAIDLNVRDALLDVVRDLVSKLTSTSRVTMVEPLDSLRHVSSSLVDTLSRLGVMIGCDAALHTRLCRLLAKAYVTFEREARESHFHPSFTHITHSYTTQNTHQRSNTGTNPKTF